MRKEVIVAIILGIVFGVIIGFGVWRANSALNDRGEDKVSTSNGDNVDIAPADVESKITIRGLQSGDVITQNPLKLNGNTLPNSRVVVSGEEEDYVIVSDGSGEFMANVDLIGGVNQIRVFVFSESVNIEEELDLIFSSKFETIDEEIKSPEEENVEE